MRWGIGSWKTRLFFKLRPVNPCAAVLPSKPTRVYEHHIFGFNVEFILVRPFRLCLPTLWMSTWYTTAISTKYLLSPCKSADWHRGWVSVLFVVNAANLRRWARKQGSCLGLQRVPWPLSRAYYHLLESARLESQFPSGTVSAIEEKGENWIFLLRAALNVTIMSLWWLVYNLGSRKTH